MEKKSISKTSIITLKKKKLSYVFLKAVSVGVSEALVPIAYKYQKAIHEFSSAVNKFKLGRYLFKFGIARIQEFETV